jgi:hypothetical protein
VEEVDAADPPPPLFVVEVIDGIVALDVGWDKDEAVNIGCGAFDVGWVKDANVKIGSFFVEDFAIFYFVFTCIKTLGKMLMFL